ncbi:hypothetical protein Tco_0173939 [Tanacetum coccineum]
MSTFPQEYKCSLTKRWPSNELTTLVTHFWSIEWRFCEGIDTGVLFDNEWLSRSIKTLELVMDDLGSLLKTFKSFSIIFRVRKPIAEGGDLQSNDSDLDMLAADPKVLSQGAAIPSHRNKEIPTKRVCPHTREIQGIDHLTVAAETLKVTTRALAPEEQISLLRNIVTKECPHETRKHYQKVKAVQEDIGSQNNETKSSCVRTRLSQNMVNINTYDGSEELDSSLKNISGGRLRTERWARPTGATCSIPTRWNARVCRKSSYDKDPLEIHKIKQKDGESTKELVRRYKLECEDVKRAPECMKISGFMHGITNPELIKRLHDKIPKTEQKQDRFTLLTKTPKEILALDKGKFKPPPSMITLVEKRNASKFCEFHGEIPTKRECPHTREIQGIDHPTVAAGTLKVTTRALAPEEQSSLLRNIVTKECPHKTQKHCQKVKAVQEDIGSQDQRDKSRVWRTTSPNYGYVRKWILSLIGSITLTFQKPECLVTSIHMMEVKIQKIT